MTGVIIALLWALDLTVGGGRGGPSPSPAIAGGACLRDGRPDRELTESRRREAERLIRDLAGTTASRAPRKRGIPPKDNVF